MIRVTFALLLLTACSTGANVTPSQPGDMSGLGRPTVQHRRASLTANHIVIIVQENRSLDNLFNGFPGAYTQRYGYDGTREVALQEEPLNTAWDVGHGHPDFLAACDLDRESKCNMDGFNRESYLHCPCPNNAPYSYVPERDVEQYWSMAQQYTLADEMYETSEGPSFPAHQYIMSGTSTTYDGSPYRASENPTKDAGGCDSPRGTTVAEIDSQGNEDRTTYPCFNRKSIIGEIDDAYDTWNYYQSAKAGVNQKSGFWKAVDALEPIWEKTDEYNDHVISPPSQFLTDIHGKLADVTWVTPTGAASDHASETDGTGPAWVASVVNAIGESSYWYNTVIIVVWDDWGGWYDQAAPTIRNSYELGFRVPMIVIGPYAKTGYVSHTHYEFGSILKFIEEQYGLPSLGTTDVDVNDLSDCFDWYQKPTPFTPISGSLLKVMFDNDPTADNGPPDEN
jgi:phospholipase C